MTDRRVLLLGDFSNERTDLTSIGRDFGWSIAQASDLSGLREIDRTSSVIAVLVKTGATGAFGMPWPEALRGVRAAAPRARIILCHKPDLAHSRGDMIDAGAFGVLLLPLSHSEVRQVLGFIWASKMAPMQHVPAPHRKVRSIDATARRVGAA